MCYGALNLLVRVDASNFVPYVCDRAVTGGEYEGPESTAHSSAISGGSVAAERSYRTPGTLAPVFLVLGLVYVLGPYTCSISFLFIIVPVPSLACPLYCYKFHLSFPKRRSQRGVSDSRA